MGDGVTFYYPDVECSPFLGRPTGIRHKYRHALVQLEAIYIVIKASQDTTKFNEMK